MITKLTEIVAEARRRGARRLAVACAADSHTLLAVDQACLEGLVIPTLFGDKALIVEICNDEGIDCSRFTIVDEKDDMKCLSMAVSRVATGEADVLMKGLVSTDKYMRAILNKDAGLFLPRARSAMCRWLSFRARAPADNQRCRRYSGP